jgi:hypothetical protein
MPWKKPCPDCGKELTWLADGSRPRAHKCEPKERPPSGEGENVENAQSSQPTGSITADRVIEAYVATRDEISKLKKAFDAQVADMKALQEKRENWLQGEMDKLGLNSFKGEHGTAFVKYKDSATVADRENFLAWVNGDWESNQHFLENRVSKAAVKQRLEDGKTLPPGVNYVKIKGVNIRRS